MKCNIPISVFALLTIVLSACRPVAAPPTPNAPSELAVASPTATPDASITIVDALGRTVILPSLPQRIVLAGRALFMIADAAYIFPSAGERIVGMGSTGQGSGNFIKLIDPDYASKQTLERDAGAEQVAALQPDLVMMKSNLAETVGAPIEALGIPVVYIDFETPEQYERDLAILGKVFGDEARAAEIAAFYQNRIKEISAAVKEAPKPRT
ncbi:MAG: ABC transporter substrate-binding protein, partial [Candidatus Roseilinea sp.]|uniref:ABC transporter substrate-binding protein n=1 Tax=Candidatus Roseilinea sp. TaxID=2838777 RepID=UPI00404A8E8B